MSPGSAPSTDTIQRCRLCVARASCLVGQLPPAQLDRLDSQIREHDFRKGETLQTEGAQPPVVRSIKVGTVMLTRTGPDGQSRAVAMVGRSHLLDVCSLIGTRSLLGAQALSAGRICELPVSVMRGILDKDPAQLDALHHQMGRSFEALADWGHVMRMKGLPRQLVAALRLLAREQGSPTVLLPSQVALAAVLSTTRESVARALRQLEEDGHLLRRDRWHGELTGTYRQVFRDPG